MELPIRQCERAKRVVEKLVVLQIDSDVQQRPP